MRSKVTSRARSAEDREGDPLDGMVNLFDLGIVLALAFLLVALASLKDQVKSDKADASAQKQQPGAVVVKPDEQEKTLPPQQGRVIGRGERVGTVYRLSDGRLVYVAPKDEGAARQGSGTAPQTGTGSTPEQTTTPPPHSQTTPSAPQSGAAPPTPSPSSP